MSWATEFHFDATPKPEADKFAPKGGWNDVVSPWTAGAISSQQPKPVELEPYQTDENLKKQYGIELAKTTNPFEAGCKVFGEDTSKALWASSNWIVDPVVIASKDAYLKTLELSLPPLDREQLAAKVLALAEGEKVSVNGKLVSTIEAKERINAYKLYSDILGYTGKVEIDASTKNTINNNKIELVLVRAADKPPLVINNAPNVKSEMPNTIPPPINLKLVKAG